MWRLRDQRYRLLGGRCEECGAHVFPAKEFCPQCKSELVQPYAFSGEGEIFSHSLMYQAPHGFEQDVPYTVALVKLAEGPLVTAQLTDMDAGEAQIGMKVELVTRVLTEDGEAGAIEYGYKFRPCLV
jgi:uncharacterized OB-fold protein